MRRPRGLRIVGELLLSLGITVTYLEGVRPLPGGFLPWQESQPSFLRPRLRMIQNMIPQRQEYWLPETHSNFCATWKCPSKGLCLTNHPI